MPGTLDMDNKVKVENCQEQRARVTTAAMDVAVIDLTDSDMEDRLIKSAEENDNQTRSSDSATDGDSISSISSESDQDDTDNKEITGDNPIGGDNDEPLSNPEEDNDTPSPEQLNMLCDQLQVALSFYLTPDDNGKLVEHIVQVQTDYQDLAYIRTDLEEENTQLKAKIDSLYSDCNNKIETIDHLKKQLQAQGKGVNSRTDSLKNQIANQKKLLDEYEAEVEFERSEKQESHEVIRNLQRKMEDCKEKIIQVEQKAVDSRVVLTNRIDQLELEIENEKIEKMYLERQLKQKIQSLNVQLTTEEAKRKQAEEDSSEFQQELKEIQTEFEDLNTKYQQDSKYWSEAKSTSDKIIEHLENQKKSAENLLSQANSQINKDFEAQLVAGNKKYEELNDRHVEVEKRIQELETEVKVERKKYLDLSITRHISGLEKSNDMSKKVSELERTKDALTMVVQNLRAELENQKAMAKQEKEKLERHIDELQIQIKENKTHFELEVGEIAKKFKAERKKVEEQHSTIDELKKDIKNLLSKVGTNGTTVLQYMKTKRAEIIGQGGDMEKVKQVVEAELIGIAVLQTCINRTCVVNGIAWDTRPTDTFDDDWSCKGTGTSISYIDYYKHKYDVDIEPLQPMLVSNGAGETQKMVVPELCILVNPKDAIPSNSGPSQPPPQTVDDKSNDYIIQKLEAQLEVLKAEQKIAEDEAKQNKAHYEDIVTKLQAEKSAMQQANKKLKLELEETKTGLIKNIQRRSELESTLASINISPKSPSPMPQNTNANSQEMNELTNKNVQLTEKCKALVASLKEKNDFITKQDTIYEKIVEGLKNRLNSRMKELEASKTEVKKLKAEYEKDKATEDSPKEVLQEILKARSRLQDCVASNSRMVSELNQLEKDNADLQNELKECKRKMRKLEAKQRREQGELSSTSYDDVTTGPDPDSDEDTKNTTKVKKDHSQGQSRGDKKSSKKKSHRERDRTSREHKKKRLQFPGGISLEPVSISEDSNLSLTDSKSSESSSSPRTRRSRRDEDDKGSKKVQRQQKAEQPFDRLFRSEAMSANPASLIPGVSSASTYEPAAAAVEVNKIKEGTTSSPNNATAAAVATGSSPSPNCPTPTNSGSKLSPSPSGKIQAVSLYHSSDECDSDSATNESGSTDQPRDKNGRFTKPRRSYPSRSPRGFYTKD